MKRVVQQTPAAAARAARSIASDSTTLRRSADASLADKFNLAALNGGKNPFQVSSNSLLKTTGNTSAVNATKTEKEVKDVYSLEYLLGGEVKKTTERTKKNPFDVASAKLM